MFWLLNKGVKNGISTIVSEVRRSGLQGWFLYLANHRFHYLLSPRSPVITCGQKTNCLSKMRSHMVSLTLKKWPKSVSKSAKYRLQERWTPVFTGVTTLLGLFISVSAWWSAGI
jgi:hypothetical protein